MGTLRNFVTPLHQATQRRYLERMCDDKVACMERARTYGPDYWDGDRRFGYGGYRYIPGRWEPVARALIETYALGPGSRVLDVGCGKGFLLYEMQRLQPDLLLSGIDVSEHGLANRHPELRADLRLGDARKPLPYATGAFDLVISLNTLHNLRLPELAIALPEITRVGAHGYVLVESHRSAQELFNLQCWALTCETFLDDASWLWLYGCLGYRGDYEFIYF